MAGQVSGMVHEIRPVAKIIAELFEGVDHVLEEAKDVYNNSK